MKTVTFLTELLGENATSSKDIIRVWDDTCEALLSVMCWKCVSSDFDMLIEVDRYGKANVNLPDWMAPKEYIQNTVSLKYFLGFGGDIEWSESWYRTLTSLDEKERYAVIKLLTQKSFRSEKRKELHDRLVNWLDGHGRLLRYDLNNVRNDYTDRECAGISTSLYHRR